MLVDFNSDTQHSTGLIDTQLLAVSVVSIVSLCHAWVGSWCSSLHQNNTSLLSVKCEIFPHSFMSQNVNILDVIPLGWPVMKVFFFLSFFFTALSIAFTPVTAADAAADCKSLCPGCSGFLTKRWQ